MDKLSKGLGRYTPILITLMFIGFCVVAYRAYQKNKEEKAVKSPTE